MKQLRDYKYRPDLRKDKKELKDKKDIYKLLPGAEKAIKYEYKNKPKNKVYTQTKKTAMTLLSGDYSTAVFGEHDPTRSLVGLLFDLDAKKNCKIKDMYLSDTGTYGRGWVGTMEEIKKFQDAHKNKRFGDINAFKEAIRNQPYALNEMLVKVTRESISAIVIANDTPEARCIARQRQVDLIAKLNIRVPIIFYDRMLRKIIEYTTEQIQEAEWLEKKAVRGNI